MPGAQGHLAAHLGTVREPGDLDPAHGRHAQHHRGDGAELLPPRSGRAAGGALSAAPGPAKARQALGAVRPQAGKPPNRLARALHAPCWTPFPSSRSQIRY